MISGLETGGAEMMLLKVIGGMDRSRWEPSVVSLADRGALGERIERLDVPVRAIGMRRPIPTPSALWKLRREVRTLSPDVVQGWMYHGNLGAFFGRAFLDRQIPVMWNIRYTPNRLRLETLSTASAIRLGAFLSRRVTRIVYNSHAGKERHAQLGYASDRAVVIPNGFDTDGFAPSVPARDAWRRRLRVSESTVLIGRIGRYHKMKDYATFLSAAAQLHRERPDVQFVLAGKGVDNANADLVERIAVLGLQDFVHLLGAVVAVNDLTASLDIACSSSAYGEAFPSVLGEAMACGVPCVATDVGDSRMVLGEATYVVPPGDPVALGHALQSLVDAGHAERRRLGERARARILQHFTLSRVLKEYDALYTDGIA